MKAARPSARSLRRQHGIATLVVVMVLFFIVSLVAAYTSRNLIFEQRTSANQYRSTQALEIAEAGLEWGLAMLNSGRITDDCLPSANQSDTSFRDRYLAIAPNGYVTGRLGASGGYLYATCVLDGTAWSCRCPTDSASPAPMPSVPTTPGVHPAFRLYFRNVGPPPTPPAQLAHPMVQIYVNACTQLIDDCLKFNPGAVGGPSVATGATNESLANVFVVAALTGTAASPPVATLTARDDVDLPALGLQVYNGDAAAGGIAIHAGRNINTPGAVVGSAPGTPADEAAKAPGDSALSGLLDETVPLTGPSLFANVFNMRSDVFRDQPATLFIACSTSCSAADVRNRILLNPGRPVWIEGNFAIDSAGDFGSASAPVLMVVNGNLDFGSVGSRITGVVYVKGNTGRKWSGSTATLRGAIVADGPISGSAKPTLIYDQAAIDAVRRTVGSFVRVPGSWRDFK